MRLCARLLVVSTVLGVLACAAEEKTTAPVEPAPTPGVEESPEEQPEVEEEETVEQEPQAAGEKEKEAEQPILDRVTPAARSAYERGIALIASDASAALAAFQNAADASPEFYVAHFNAGVLLDKQGRTEEARAAYKKALEARPGYGPAVVGLASLAERGAGPQEAESQLRRGLQANGDDVVMRAALAELLARTGRLDEAREQAIGVLRKDERNTRAMLAMGMLYRRKKMFELSILALNQAIGIDDQLGEAFAELGLVYVAQDEKAKAVKAFERAAELSPQVAAIQNNLGALRNEVGAFQGAIEALERATALESERPEYFLNLGNAYRGEQRYADAEAAYKKASEVGGGTLRALFNLGVLYLDNELDGKDVIARYRECISYLQAYRSKAGVSRKDDERINEYIQTAEKAIEHEEKRRERTERRRQERAKRDAAKEKAAPAADAEKGEAATEVDKDKAKATVDRKKGKAATEADDDKTRDAPAADAEKGKDATAVDKDRVKVAAPAQAAQEVPAGTP